MPRIERYTDFQNGAMSDAEQLDNELNRIHDLVNGGLDKDNIFPDGIESGNIRNLDGNKIIDSSLPKSKLNPALTTELDSKETIVNSDAKLALKSDKATTYTKTEVDGIATGINTNMTNGLDLKADKATTYSKTEVDTSLGLKADKSTTYTKTEMDTSLENKADKVDTYTKGEVDEQISTLNTSMGTELALKADKEDTYTKTEVDTALSGKEATLPNRSTVEQLSDDGTYLKFNGVIVGGGSGGGSVVQDAPTNGHILIDGVDTTVYDDSSVMTTLSQKADANNVYDKTQVYTKTETDTAFQKKLIEVATESTLNGSETSGTYILTMDTGKLLKRTDVTYANALPVPMTSNSQGGITLTASSIYSATYDVYKISNNNNTDTNQWSSNRVPTTAQPEWVKIDLGSVKTVNKLRLQALSTSPTAMVKDFTIQVSTDDANYTVVSTQTGQTWTANQWRDYDFTATQARYVKILITANNGNASVVQIAEAQLFVGGNPYQTVIADSKSYGVGQNSVKLSDGYDLNALSNNGFYVVYNALNRPTEADSLTGYITHNQFTDTSSGSLYATQTFTSATSTQEIYVRRKVANVWGSWSKTRTSANISEYINLNTTSIPNAVYTKVGYTSGSSYWDATNNGWKSPKKGKFKFTATISFEAMTSGATVYVRWSTQAGVYSYGSKKIVSSTVDNLTATMNIDLNTNDLVYIEVYTSTGTMSVTGSGWSHLLVEEL